MLDLLKVELIPRSKPLAQRGMCFIDEGFYLLKELRKYIDDIVQVIYQSASLRSCAGKEIAVNTVPLTRKSLIDTKVRMLLSVTGSG